MCFRSFVIKTIHVFCTARSLGIMVFTMNKVHVNGADEKQAQKRSGNREGNEIVQKKAKKAPSAATLVRDLVLKFVSCICFRCMVFAYLIARS